MPRRHPHNLDKNRNTKEGLLYCAPHITDLHSIWVFLHHVWATGPAARSPFHMQVVINTKAEIVAFGVAPLPEGMNELKSDFLS